jgi:hypothetical protein
MGMYTELNIGVKLKEETPPDVIAALNFMATGELKPDPLPDHALFRTERWDWALRSGGSYYFDARPVLEWRQDEINKQWYLTVCTNIKNYSQEWERFLDFIAPWLDAGPDEDYIGTYRYEENDRPTLLFADGATIRMEEV